MKQENRYKQLKNPVYLEQHSETEIRSDIADKIVRHTVQTRERDPADETDI